MDTETSFFDVYDVNLQDKRSMIGKGAFSTVHRCVNKRTGEVCAVKVIMLKSLRSSEINKIKREIGICSSLQHDNIVAMRKAFRDETHFYLVFEYVSGGELFDEIVTRKFYNEKDASACMCQVLSALQHCHSKKIIHRDLKPENLLLSSKEANAPVKITDFGLAVIMEQGPTYFGFAGTPGYLSPEVIRRVPYDTAVDVWACGVILYILLVGYPPFWEDDHQKLYAQIKNCHYDFPSPEWDSVTPAAKDLIKAMLEPNPKRRPTVQELLQHPWIDRRDTVPGSVHRQSTLEELKKFNAKRKLRGGVNAVIGLGKMMRTMQEATRALSVSRKSKDKTITAESQDGGDTTAKALLELNELLLQAIAAGDWDAYTNMVDPNVTCFEPEAAGVLAKGLSFHKFFFDNRSPHAEKMVTTIHDPAVRVFGDTGVLTCLRVVQFVTEDGPKTTRFEETRVWVKDASFKHGWKLVHFHRSGTQGTPR